MSLRSGVLFTVLALCAMSANAEDGKPMFTATNPSGTQVTLMGEPCNEGPWLAGWKTASMIWDGKTYAACWRFTTDSTSEISVIDSLGDIGYWPAFMFKKTDEMPKPKPKGREV